MRFPICAVVMFLGGVASADKVMPPERLLHLWLDVFNSGDAARATKFEAEHVSSKAREGKSPEHHVLLDAEHTDLVITGKVDTPGGGRYAYGFGEDRVDGKRVVGHNGGAPGMNATLNMYWDAGLTVIVMANLDPPAADKVNKYIRERITP